MSEQLYRKVTSHRVMVTESERGWGQKHEYEDFATKEAALRRVKEINDDNTSDEAPDLYFRAEYKGEVVTYEACSPDKQGAEQQEHPEVPTKKDFLSLGDARNFVKSFLSISAFVHTVAKEKGWWDTEREDGTMIALMHSELSEALEGLRAGNPPDKHVGGLDGGGYKSVEVELADVIIRIMDLATRRGWRVGNAIIAKALYNTNRPKRHGGKAF